MNFNAFDFFNFCANQGKSMTEEIVYLMKEEIDEKVLCPCVEKALEIFPNWRNMPYIDESGHIAFRKNDNPVPVYPDDHKCANLGTDDSNGYLFRLVYEGKRISLYCFHALGDGNIVITFLSHVIYYYLTALGHKIDGEPYIFSEIPSTADEDVVKKSAAYLESLGDSLSLEDVKEQSSEGRFVEDFVMEHYKTPNARSIHIVCDNVAYRKYCREYHLSSTTFLIDLMSKATYEAYGITDKRMDVSTAVDLRKALHSQSFHNFAYGAMVSYDYSMLDMEDSSRYDLIRTRLKKAIRPEILASYMAELGTFLDTMGQYYTKSAYKAVEAKHQEQQKGNAASFYISNLSKIPIPEGFYDYIENIYTAANPVKPETNYYITGFNNFMNIVIRQNFDNAGVANKLVERLNSLGIAASIKVNEIVTMDYVSIENFNSYEDLKK